MGHWFSGSARSNPSRPLQPKAWAYALKPEGVSASDGRSHRECRPIPDHLSGQHWSHVTHEAPAGDPAGWSGRCGSSFSKHVRKRPQEGPARVPQDSLRDPSLGFDTSQAGSGRGSFRMPEPVERVSPSARSRGVGGRRPADRRSRYND